MPEAGEGLISRTMIHEGNTLSADGWFTTCRHVPSPNFDPRPAIFKPDLLVIHNISLPPEEFGGDYIEKLFCNCLDPGEHPYFAQIADLRVSSHLLIDRLGCLTQFVSLADRAWHAGASMWQGRANCNDYSIGIELEGSDYQPFTKAQYLCLAAVTRTIQARYSAITSERIVGHSDIAPERKTDPGPHFDWSAYKSMLSV